MSFQRTMVCLRKAHIRIPMLSPTHTRAKIVRWCLETPDGSALPQPTEVESYDPLFVLQCSPDLVTEGYRQHETHEPKMIVEVHDEASGQGGRTGAKTCQDLGGAGIAISN